ncbi:MAG: helix-turn-helix domain-containing protein [Sphingomonas sp.]
MSLSIGRSSDTERASYRLRYYRPGLVQEVHRHEQPHLSLVIAGSVAEASAGQERHVGAGHVVLRATGFEHKVRFGAAGALILSAPFGNFEHIAAGASEWGIAPAALIGTLVNNAAFGNAEGVVDVIWDLLAKGTFGSRLSPQWLLRARAELIEENASISEIAQNNGVHRVHFSRLFQQVFGEPPSVCRRRMRALRAAAGAAQGTSGTQVAHACGFFDQSHMCRALQESLGATFTQLRRVRTQVTSVQG